MPALPAAAQGGGEDFLRRSLDVELRLLRQDLAEVERARTAEAEARTELDAVLSQVASVAGGSVAGSAAAANNLGRFADRLQQATEAAEAATGRSRLAMARLQMRLQRAALLSGLLIRGELPAVSDLLTGRWNVALGPTASRGVFELNQDGTLVEGSYRFDDGRRGSLRGNLVGTQVRLELLDSRLGFAAIFEGRVDRAAGTMEGFWRPTEVSGGAPGGGGWSARWVPDDAGGVEEGAS